MENATVRPTTVRLLLASLAVVMVMFAIFGGNAKAIEVTFVGKNLPGKVWTCGHCIEQKALDLIGAKANTTSTVCTGAVQYNGSSWYQPYGWKCEPENPVYSFPAITAFAAIYNPNPGTFKEFGFVAWG